MVPNAFESGRSILFDRSTVFDRSTYSSHVRASTDPTALRQGLASAEVVFVPTSHTEFVDNGNCYMRLGIGETSDISRAEFSPHPGPSY
jgi:hypothetical protein